MKKQIFLLRHADYEGGGADPALSISGKNQALVLAQKIKSVLGEGDITIWSSSASRAKETAQIIKEEMQLAEMIIEEKLWSDNSHEYDFDWLKRKIEDFSGEILIIVSHLEYVRYFPSKLGFRPNSAGYAQGIKIQDNQCVNF